MTEVSPIQEEQDAIKRVGFTADGRIMHRYLRRVLETVIDMPPSDGALFAQNGRRSLARDLMRLMAEGIDAGTRNDTAAEHAGNAAVLVRAGQPVSAGGRGTRRRAVPEHPGLGNHPDGGEPES